MWTEPLCIIISFPFQDFILFISPVSTEFYWRLNANTVLAILFSTSVAINSRVLRFSSLLSSLQNLTWTRNFSHLLYILNLPLLWSVYIASFRIFLLVNYYCLINHDDYVLHLVLIFFLNLIKILLVISSLSRLVPIFLERLW